MSLFRLYDEETNNSKPEAVGRFQRLYGRAAVLKILQSPSRLQLRELFRQNEPDRQTRLLGEETSPPFRRSDGAEPCAGNTALLQLLFQLLAGSTSCVRQLSGPADARAGPARSTLVPHTLLVLQKHGIVAAGGVHKSACALCSSLQARGCRAATCIASVSGRVARTIDSPRERHPVASQGSALGSRELARGGRIGTKHRQPTRMSDNGCRATAHLPRRGSGATERESDCAVIELRFRLSGSPAIFTKTLHTFGGSGTAARTKGLKSRPLTSLNQCPRRKLGAAAQRLRSALPGIWQ